MRHILLSTLCIAALPAAAVEEQPIEDLPAAPAQSVPLELPPDIRGDMRSFLDALGTQTTAESAPADEANTEPEEAAEPVPADEANTEPEEAAEPAPADESNAEPEEVAEPVPADESNAEPEEAAEPAPADESHAEPEEVAKPAPADESHAESAEIAEIAEPVPAAGGEAAPAESTPAVKPPVVDSVQSLASAYPALPVAAGAPVINVLAAPNGLTWQGLEVDEEDLFERIGIFGQSEPNAFFRLQAFPDTPAAIVRKIVDAARKAGFSRVSVLLPAPIRPVP